MKSSRGKSANLPRLEFRGKSRFPRAMVISVLITCVASEYGVRESLFTSNDPNMMGTPEELEGLSCCVGTIFGPLPKELHVHFTSIEQRRQVGDSHHNPARFAERKDFEDYFSSFTLATRNRSFVAGDSLVGSHKIRCTFAYETNPVISQREISPDTIRKKKTSARFPRNKTRDVRPKDERLSTLVGGRKKLRKYVNT